MDKSPGRMSLADTFSVLSQGIDIEIGPKKDLLSLMSID